MRKAYVVNANKSIHIRAVREQQEAVRAVTYAREGRTHVAGRGETESQSATGTNW